MLGRLYELAIKLISVKGLAFGFATAFMFLGWLEAYWWVVLTLLLIGTRAFEKVFDHRE